jgi:histidine ammonia-lyase
VIENCWNVLAIELLLAVQAIDFNQGLKLSPTAQRIRDEVRERVTFLERDRVVHDDILAARAYLDEHREEWRTGLGLG